MATVYVKNLLQSEMLAALALAPAGTAFTTKKAGDMQGSMEGLDPAKFPAIVVEMPEETGSQQIAENMARVDYVVIMHLHIAEQDAVDRDTKMGELVNKVRVSLSGYRSANMRRLGWMCGDVAISDEGWGQRDQNSYFLITAGYTLHIPTSRLIDDTD